MLDSTKRSSGEPTSAEAPGKVCSLCGEVIPPGTARVHHLAEAWVLEQIRREHPQWVEDDGLCPRCLEHYLAIGRAGG